MQTQQDTKPEKRKHRQITRYEKIKSRILIFIAVVIATQAVLSLASFQHLQAHFDEFCPQATRGVSAEETLAAQFEVQLPE